MKKIARHMESFLRRAAAANHPGRQGIAREKLAPGYLNRRSFQEAMPTQGRLDPVTIGLAMLCSLAERASTLHGDES